MKILKTAALLDNNRRWATARRDADPHFFERLCAQQAPDYLWIGCSDSRVPANEIVDLDPGELFVHRNVANVVMPGDANCLSVIQFAVDTLKVEHIIVCGHYGCGGVEAAYAKREPGGSLGHWLDAVEQVYELNRVEIDAIADPDQRVRLLCERNVVEQMRQVTRTTTVRAAWRRDQALTVHAWVYDLSDGLLRELVEPVASEAAAAALPVPGATAAAGSAARSA